MKSVSESFNLITYLNPTNEGLVFSTISTPTPPTCTQQASEETKLTLTTKWSGQRNQSTSSRPIHLVNEGDVSYASVFSTTPTRRKAEKANTNVNTAILTSEVSQLRSGQNMSSFTGLSHLRRHERQRRTTKRPRQWNQYHMVSLS